jgi:hypothetical protein
LVRSIILDEPKILIVKPDRRLIADARVEIRQLRDEAMQLSH